MKTFVKKNWKWILLILVLGIMVIRIAQGTSKDPIVINSTSAPVVEAYTLEDIVEGTIDLSCQVEPVSEVEIIPEYAGTITKVSVKEGSTVKKGDTLFNIENIQQRVAVADARVALESAQLALADLQNENDASSSTSLLAQTTSQQETLINDAYNRLLNNDLRVYPEDDPEDVRGDAPEISGNYNCTTEGEYIIEIYSSSSDSGASFRYTGLESGTSTVSITGFGTPVGVCGLELIFPEDFDKNETWVLPVPNTRSATYPNLLRAYESALNNKEISLNQTTVSDEVINQAKGRVNQARLRYELALDNLSKTVVKAKTNGVVSGFDLDTGDYVSAFVSLGQIKTNDDLELVAYINPAEQAYLDANSSIFINDSTTSIDTISQTIDSVTRKLKLVIVAPEGLKVQEGLSVPCSIERQTNTTQREDNGEIVPLSAISIIGIDPYIFTIDDDSNSVSAQPVTTGGILGDQIVVYGLESTTIVKDARGIRDGQEVTVETQ